MDLSASHRKRKKLEFLSLDEIVANVSLSVSFIHQLLQFFIDSRYSQFVQGQNLKDSQCIVFAHHRPSAADLTRTQLRKFIIVTVCSDVQCGKQWVINKNVNSCLPILHGYVEKTAACISCSKTCMAQFCLVQPSVFL